MSGDGGAGIVGSSATGSVCSTSSAPFVSAVVSGAGSTLVVFSGSSFVFVVWFDSGFCSSRLLWDWLLGGSSVLVSSRSVSPTRYSAELWVLQWRFRQAFVLGFFVLWR